SPKFEIRNAKCEILLPEPRSHRLVEIWRERPPPDRHIAYPARSTWWWQSRRSAGRLIHTASAAAGWWWNAWRDARSHINTAATAAGRWSRRAAGKGRHAESLGTAVKKWKLVKRRHAVSVHD